MKKYTQLRKTIKHDIKLAHDKYMNECERILKNDPKKVWNMTTGKLDKRGVTPQCMTFNNVSYTNPEVIANKFAEHFESLYNNEKSSDVFNDFLKSTTNNFTNLITENEVLAAINKLKSKTSCGPDLIPSFIIKGCAEHLIGPLCYLFNLSIKCSVYPDLWKSSRVCPVFKKGNKNDGKNYRPVSVLNGFSKCFELVLCERLYYHVKTKLAPEQHGFIKGRSTVTNLIEFTSYASDRISRGSQVDTVFFDFSRAFDLVDHSILLMKLTQLFDVPLYLVFLLKSYLSDRSQFVTYNNCRSKVFCPKSGVPQGSNLGPILFCCFVNDLTAFIKFSSCFIFADDLKICKEILTTDDNEILQADIDSVIEWSKFNKMIINEGKCEVVHFSRKTPIIQSYILNGTTLKQSNLTKDLGVYLDNRLSFNFHAAETIKSANRMLSFVIRSCKNFKKVTTYKMLYYALVRSKLDYASSVWNPYHQKYIDAIERVQKRFLRYLYFRTSGVYPHYINHPVRSNELLSIFNMISLEKRRKISDCVFVFKLINNHYESSALLEKIEFRINLKNVRNLTMLLVRGSLTVPLYRMINELNLIPVHINMFSCTLTKFINELKSVF